MDSCEKTRSRMSGKCELDLAMVLCICLPSKEIAYANGKFQRSPTKALRIVEKCCAYEAT